DPAAFLREFDLRDDIAFDCQTSYTFRGADVLLHAHIRPIGDLPNLPRIGLQWSLPRRFDQFWWHGRGPLETYPDRKQGMRLGLYHAPVDALFTPYGRPQENGARTDVTWAACLDDTGAGLLVAGEGVTVSAQRLTAADLEAAGHLHQLKPRDEIILSVDFQHAGLGNASCGPGVLPKYTIPPREASFSLRLRPVRAGESLLDVAASMIF
ncbi:MAG TPA: beta-galactosidase small subunit, partial [Anaerolineaceae bacterium]